MEARRKPLRSIATGGIITMSTDPQSKTSFVTECIAWG